MRIALTTLALWLAPMFSTLAQAPQPALPRYSSTTGDVSLSGSAYSFTLQQPSSNPKTMYLESAVVYVSAAANITQAEYGGAATATAGTVVPLAPLIGTPSGTTWTASNVGAGTAVGGIIHVPSGGLTTVIDLSQIVLPAGGTAVNYTVTIAAGFTGTANITLFWKEATVGR